MVKRRALAFSLLSFMVGITGWLPAITLRKFGTRLTYGIGGGLMAVGFALMATTDGLTQYLVGAAVAGVGYTLCANRSRSCRYQSLVAATSLDCHRRLHDHRWFGRRSGAVDRHGNRCGHGNLANPLVGDGRLNYRADAAGIGNLEERRKAGPGTNPRAKMRTPIPVGLATSGSLLLGAQWTLPEVLRTPQYYIIVAGLTMTLFGGVTMNTWAVTHMGNLGIAVAVAAAALSTHALINAFSRAVGGALAAWVDPKWLLASAPGC